MVASLVMLRAVDWIERRGIVLLLAIALYGVATVIFGVSRAFWLTFACLAATGAADTVSTVDDLDLVQGRVATTLALADLRTGVRGHYGYGDDADSAMPERPPA